MKVCNACKIEKDLTEFGKYKSMIDGLNTYCKLCAREKDRASHAKHREARNLKTSNYCKANKERRNIYQNERHHKRKIADPMYILKRRYRNRLKKVFRYKGIVKVTSSMEFLGCTAEEFKQYFENLFTSGMTWDAVYAGEIHIDHITPISTAKSEEDLIKLSHYTNLQPLWAIDNLKKGRGKE